MKKVVVIEDEDLVRRGIVLTVDWQKVDCTVVGEAANGREGLALIRETRPDLIVTDIKMPILDGLDMVKQLREEGNQAQVIFLTAYSDFSYAQAAVKLGAVDYLLKPFHDGELEETVERLSRNRSAPHIPGFDLPVGASSKYVTEAIKVISQRYGQVDLSVGAVAQELGISEGHLSHVFKKETGNTLGSYLTAYRMHRATELLRDVRTKVGEVAEQVGYRDIAYFSAAFKKAVGMTPSEYQRTAQK